MPEVDINGSQKERTVTFFFKRCIMNWVNSRIYTVLGYFNLLVHQAVVVHHLNISTRAVRTDSILTACGLLIVCHIFSGSGRHETKFTVQFLLMTLQRQWWSKSLLG
jgi:hypothetical protein